MKLTRSTGRFRFSLSKRESQLFLETLRLYPRIPPAHHRLSNSDDLPRLDDNQKLLDDALAEQRAANKRQLRAFLDDPKKFSQSDTGAVLSLSPVDAEWLLQVLNDIRVGSWITLGCPPERFELQQLNEKTAPHLWAMEMSGHFQAHLLEALDGGT